MNGIRGNYRSSEFFIAARELDQRQTTLAEISAKLRRALDYCIHSDGTFRSGDFNSLLAKKFKEGSGYYGWVHLRYFLYEYELDLLAGSRQKKVEWGDLLKTKKDWISVEHIYPQTPTSGWESAFATVPGEQRRNFNGSLGNLLLLSTSINSSLQNDDFESKKRPKFDKGDRTKKIRNGYADGSHSEIEVAAYDSWGPDEIRERGLKLLGFLEMRWKIRFRDEERERLLFLDFA